MKLEQHIPYLDYDQELEIPPHITIIDNNGKELTLSLVVWIDYDGQWHAGYRNWIAETPMHESYFLIDAGLKSSFLLTVLEELKIKLKVGLYYETTNGELEQKGGAE